MGTVHSLDSPVVVRRVIRDFTVEVLRITQLPGSWRGMISSAGA